ncbi:MAG: dipeptidase [Cytophagaceae bacterium]|nr:dipeptidase [Cytophagaceae bacterium]MDW8457260.1 dipeptidase [Cytophagaceae bacterium]
MRNKIFEHHIRYLNELFDFLRIPSVSADSAYRQEVMHAAEWLCGSLSSAGLDKAEIFSTDGFPVVYAEKIVDPMYPTVLIYGHYDVQPPDPLNLWISPPFQPEIRNGRIYARGACDDKGQLYMHIKAIELMLANKDLPCNVKCIFEGEEEIGSDNLGKFIHTNRERLKADVVLISDTSIFSNDTPTLTVGLRGLSYLEVEITGPNRDLHSGVYGGGVANPINVLCRMIASLHDDNHRITIPGFYNDVLSVSEEEKTMMNQLPFSLEEYKDQLGIEDVCGESGYNTIERTSVRPTLDVNGIWGGYTGEGAKTVLPSKAFAKISMRLVPNQSSEKITELFIKHFTSIAPSSVKVNIKPHHGGEPCLTPVESQEYRAAAHAFEEVWGKKPIPVRSGGSIPVVSLFEKILSLKTVLLGFGLDEDNIHSPNESFRIDNFLKGIETIIAFYHHYAELKKI